jgi:cytochrome c556
MRLPQTSTTLLALLAGTAMILPTAAAAQDDEPPPAVEYRQGIMNSLRTQTGSLRSIVDGEVAYAGHARARAQSIHELAQMLSDIFPESATGGRAKSEIWQDADDFAEKVAAIQSAAAQLAEVAEMGDLEAVGEALGGVQQTCRGCHMTFRARGN